MDKFIVAEISKSWTDPTSIKEILSQKFEQVINVNYNRGYKITDWKISSIIHEGVLTETIIAIFERID